MALEQQSALGSQLAIDFVSGLSVLQMFLTKFSCLREFFLMAVNL